jgi:hypothetical protein
MIVTFNPDLLQAYLLALAILFILDAHPLDIPYPTPFLSFGSRLASARYFLSFVRRFPLVS